MLERIIDQLLERLAAAPAVEELLTQLAGGERNAILSQARGGSVAALAALVARRATRPVLLLTSSIERAEALTDGTAFFGARPMIFPAFETLPFETSEPVLHILAARLRVLAALSNRGAAQQAPLIVAPVDAMSFLTLPPEEARRRAVRIEWGQSLDVEDLARRLVELGYEREALVEAPGEFAIRGSIIDIFPPDADLPWRLDLFGDELDQIRRFMPDTQRSLERVTEIEAIDILPATIQRPKLEWLEQGGELAPFTELMPKDTLIIIDGSTRVEQRLLHFDSIADRHWSDRKKSGSGDEAEAAIFEQGDYKPGQWLLRSGRLQQLLQPFERLEISEVLDESERSPFGAPHEAAPYRASLEAHSFEAVPSQFEAHLGMMRERLRRGHRVMIVCDNPGQVMRLDELLRENEVSAAPLLEGSAPRGLPRTAQDTSHDVMLCTGALHEGFYCEPARMLVVTDREIFGRYKRRHIYRKAYHGKAMTSPTEIKRGDYVVHVEHGIGFFEGIRRQQVDGRMGEFLELIYQDDARLLVPVEKLHMVQKYAAGDQGKAPTLDKLGGKKWASRKRKSMEAVRKMAGELLELYARRAAAQGYAYGDETVWQREFEASFIYQETPDQLKAIEQVKADMSSPKPMDRLVCGDVGYGKTEVAIRAAFKALTEKRQVAVLAPTTLLVSQHFSTFKERFADYPFKIEMLSRFRTPQQVRLVLQKLKEGELDLVIGTHRLLSTDVKFRDLGLLVVDEEQRFGVAQKEKIKRMRADVDILTLTATPIPRTLYMALSGLRDLSVITTPPADRHPIKTRTIHWDREQIEEAILRELNRGGQVFFVHNRVGSIQEVAATLQEIVPHARIAVGHGQMEEDELEKIMLDFIAGKQDILISTTIIENGIDIPNVNTIIINRADSFGLAQLYQLRGRVGRDVRQAYAYLILPPGQAITPQAIKRLEALEEFTDLGVGFTIAMRDMEIRGTGNLLGSEQHGAIADIGFELYCQLLEEAVEQLKGQAPAEPLWPVEIRWPADQFLPEAYIPIESQRIRFYKDIAAARTREDLDLLLEELVDRYGTLPPEAQNLVNVCRLKLAASPWRIDAIRLGPDVDWVRIKAVVFSVELATALAERAQAGRLVFNKLRRQGEHVILDIRQTDEPFTPPQVLATLADFLDALPSLDHQS